MIWFGKKKEAEAVAPVTPAPAAAPAVDPVQTSIPEPEPDPVQEFAAKSAPAAEPVAVPEAASAPASEPAPEPAPVAAPPPPAPAPKAQPNANNRKELYYSLMNALYDVILVVDDNGHLMDCNSRVEHVFGYSRDDAWDMPLTQLVPGITTYVFAQMKAGLVDDRRVLLNAPCRRKDGTVFPGEVGAGMMEIPGKSKKNIVISIRNIEKRSPAKAIIRKK